MAALSPANAEAKLSSTTTTTAECSVQAGRVVGLNNRPNGETGFVHFITSRSDKLDSLSFQVRV